jgi:hypothetical protein
MARRPATHDHRRGALSPLAARRSVAVARWVGVVLIPWSGLLAVALPARARAQHWNVAWAGLDLVEGLTALATAKFLHDDDDRFRLSAAACGTLLVVDAWFDVCTAGSGASRSMAVAMAVCAELPLASAAFWLAGAAALPQAVHHWARDRQDGSQSP